MKSAEIAEILINYAEEIIDLATELQYLLVERYGIEWGDSNSEQACILQQKMPILPVHRGKEKRTQETPQEVGANISMQKLYVPVFRLQANNSGTDTKN